uniref:Ubiquitin carboxyl-terminal hydrolase n=1 Tax=Eptatretus burgeri TaxID=7764 RepID=A0A8C4R3G2_EPTBU
MERCRHVSRLKLPANHSVLYPERWCCEGCGDRDSPWACLACSGVGCGRDVGDHAGEHARRTGHPLAMDLVERCAFCFLCGEYVLNDNTMGDLKLLRGALGAASGRLGEGPATRAAGRVRRGDAFMAEAGNFWQNGSYAVNGGMLVAVRYWRLALLRRAFAMWLAETPGGLRRLEEERKEREADLRREESRRRRAALKQRFCDEMAHMPPRKSQRLSSHKAGVVGGSTATAWRQSGSKKDRGAAAQRHGGAAASLLTPGITGLRNLGNTCYMNSILQVLSHLQKFRESFLALDMGSDTVTGRPGSDTASGSQNHMPVPPPPSPLPSIPPSLARSGLFASPTVRSLRLLQSAVGCQGHLSLCRELHTLFRVMWSGKWALVSPFAMLHSVWKLIPSFKGYGQQDAQEFLCELLDRVQRELEAAGGWGSSPMLMPLSHRTLLRHVLQVVNTIFQGQLLSQVTCLSCRRKSDTVEPFWDLSLDFPERYHLSRRPSPSHTACTLLEMLAKFTETEALEGHIYACSRCSGKRHNTNSKPLLLTEAKKQLLVCRLPQVLRLHLKRFRWSGRNHREKIGVHVVFDTQLNMRSYCTRAGKRHLPTDSFVYDLSAVVQHHGRGFGSGHYTSYVYNTEGGFWVHCNDSELSVCSVEDVCRAQAYILFYSQRGPPDNRSPIAVSDATAVVAGNIPLVLADRPNPADTVICDGSESATDFDNSKCQNRAPLLPQPPPPSLQLPHTVVVAHEDGDEVNATPVSGKGSVPTEVPQVSGAEAGRRADIVAASSMPGEELSELNGDETVVSPAVMGINFDPSPCHSPTCPVACDPGIPLTSSIHTTSLRYRNPTPKIKNKPRYHFFLNVILLNLLHNFFRKKIPHPAQLQCAQLAPTGQSRLLLHRHLMFQPVPVLVSSQNALIPHLPFHLDL